MSLLENMKSGQIKAMISVLMVGLMFLMSAGPIMAEYSGDAISQDGGNATTPAAFPTPWLDDFEFGVLGGSTGVNWTTTDITLSGVSNAISQSGINSLYTCGGSVVVNSSSIDTSSLSYTQLTFWIMRGDDGVIGSEDTDAGENFVVSYLNDLGSWITLEIFLGSGLNGEIMSREYSLPADANHANFQVQFEQTAGSGFGMDYWHVDDVMVREYTPFEVEVTPGSQTGSAPAGGVVDHHISIENIGILNDTYDLSVSGNTWPVTFRNMADTMDITMISVPVGNMIQVIVRVNIANTAMPGDSDLANITVTSQSDGSVEDKCIVNTEFYMTVSSGGAYFVTGSLSDWAYVSNDGSQHFIFNTFDWVWPTYANSGEILLIWDEDAWNDAWRTEMGLRSIPFTQVTGSAVNASMLDSTTYPMIIISEMMYTASLPNMESLVTEFEDYVLDGGVLIDMIGTNNLRRWSQGTPGPFGTVTDATTDLNNYVAEVGHEMVENIPMPFFSGNSASHARITTSPNGSIDLLTTGTTPGGVPVACWLEFTSFENVTVLWTSPANDSTSVPVNNNIVVVYDQNMNSSDIPVLSQVGGTDPGGWTFTGWSSSNINNDTATWTHNDWALNQTVNMTVYNGSSISGNVPIQYNWTFNTTLGGVTTANATGPIGTWSNNADIDIQYVTTGGPSTVDIYYSTNGGATWTLIGTDDPADGSFLWTIPGEGVYSWIAVSPDEIAPVPTDIPEISSYQYDATSPASSADLITPYWHESSLLITATANDALSGVSSVQLYYRYSADNASWGGWILFNTDSAAAYDFNFDFPQSDGYYEFYTIAMDNAFNMEAAPGSADAICAYDPVPPASWVDMISPYLQHMSPLLITATASDATTSVDYVELWYRYSNFNFTWGAWTIIGNDTTSPYSYSFTFPNGEGYYQFYTRAMDNNSQYEPAPVMADTSCQYELIIPDVTSVVPVDASTGIDIGQDVSVVYDGTMNTLVTPILTQTGGTNPGGWVFVGWSTTNVADDTATWTHSDWTYAQLITLQINGGENLYGNSLANPATWSFTTFVPDMTPPVVDAGNDRFENSIFTQYGSATDAESGVDGYEWTQESGPGTITFQDPYNAYTQMEADTDGVYVVSLMAYDFEGNSATDTFRLVWDTVVPIVDAGPNSTRNKQFTQYGTVIEEGSGISYYSWTVEIGYVSHITFGSSYDNQTTIRSDSDRTYTIRFTVSDLAGNSAYDEFTLVWDTTSPMVTITPSGNDVPIDTNITLSFDEEMNRDSVEAGLIILWNNGDEYVEDDTITGTFNWNDAGSEVSFDPDDPLSYSMKYTVEFTNSVRDIAGNKMGSDGGYKGFITMDEPIPPAGDIEGQILDNNDEPIEGAVVEIMIDGVSYSDTTDSDGNFEIEGVPVGTHDMTVTKGTVEDTISVVIEPDDTTEVPPFNLVPETVEDDGASSFWWILLIIIVVVILILIIVMKNKKNGPPQQAHTPPQHYEDPPPPPGYVDQSASTMPPEGAPPTTPGEATPVMPEEAPPMPPEDMPPASPE